MGVSIKGLKVHDNKLHMMFVQAVRPVHNVT